MPLPKGTKFRFRKLSGGRKQRLAFNPKGKVIEAVMYSRSGKKGKVHEMMPGK